MKKKKLQLKTLKVKSFVTTMNAEETEALKGGAAYRTYAEDINVAQGIRGRRPLWTVTEQRRTFLVTPTRLGGRRT